MVTELQKDNRFVPPSPRIGDQVIFYPVPGAWRNYTVATVVKTGQKAISLVTAEGRPMDQVRHRDDPRLREASIGEFGAWEFTEHQIQLNRLDSFLGTLEAIKDDVAENARQIAMLHGVRNAPVARKQEKASTPKGD